MRAAKVALATVTLLLLASAGGGFLLLPAIAPLHVWAARRSGRSGRVSWCLAAGLGIGMTAWAAVYRLAGESEPAIWLVPCLFTVAGTGAMVAVVRGLEGGNAA